MKEYFVNRLWFSLVAVPLQGLPIFMLGALAYHSIAAGVDYKVATGLLILALIGALLWWLSFPLRKPLVRISNERIEVLNPFGMLRAVEDPRRYTLVIASDWVGFRLKGHNDIMVEKGRFLSKKTYESFLRHVQELPFAAVV
jgi:hypothetical protein